MSAHLQLTQKQFLKGTVTLTLPPDGDLKYAFKSLRQSREYTIELRDLDPNPVRSHHRSIGWWVFGLLVLGGLLALWVAIFRSISYEPLGERIGMCVLPAIFLLPIGLGSLSKAIKEGFDISVFCSRWNGQALVSISNQHPSPAEASAFIAALSERAKQASPVSGGADGVAGQLAQLADLHSKGVLTEEEFAKAKQRVLVGSGDDRKIGFHS